MPTVPQGPLEGAEFYRVKVTREANDTVAVSDTERIPVMRVSIGGNDEIGFYCVFRGEPDAVLKMLEVVHEAAKQMLPAGRYKDNR